MALVVAQAASAVAAPVAGSSAAAGSRPLSLARAAQLSTCVRHGSVTLSNARSKHFTDQSGFPNNYGLVHFTVARGARQARCLDRLPRQGGQRVRRRGAAAAGRPARPPGGELAAAGAEQLRQCRCDQAAGRPLDRGHLRPGGRPDPDGHDGQGAVRGESNQFFGFLVDPHGQMQGVGSNYVGTRLSAGGNLTLGSERQMNVYADHPVPGIWTLVIEFAQPSVGNEISEA